jgi:hypothetical protein
MVPLHHHPLRAAVAVVLAAALAATGAAQQINKGGNADKVVDPAMVKEAQGKSTGADDLRFHVSGSFTPGGIGMHWGLVITPPPGRRFEFFYQHLHITRFLGTYETRDGYATFTGKLSIPPGLNPPKKPDEKDYQVGHNYVILKNNQPQFYLLVPAADGTYLYRRHWAEGLGEGKWLRGEEHKLTFTPGKAKGDLQTFTVKGEQRFWVLADKKDVREKVEAEVIYKRQGTILTLEGKAHPIIPSILEEGETSPHGYPYFYVLSHRNFGHLAGFTF